MNIFETIGKVTSRVEAYHSQFLADALTDSLNGDRSLFEAVWKLVVPPDWGIPAHAEVSSEEVVERGQKIDICVRSVSPHNRVVGIEIKTVDASVTPGQLVRYLDGLKRKFPESAIQIAYLTPFNRERAGDAAGRLPTVREFEKFATRLPQARHVSLLDVADVPWDGNVLWKQHQAYVQERISVAAKLWVNTERNRKLDEFFGEELAQRFWEELAVWKIYAGDNGADINLANFGDDLPSFAGSLVRALEILLDSDNVLRNTRPKTDKFREKLRRPFLTSPYRQVHAALFGLAQLRPYVWVEGGGNYGVRTAHKNHPGGVSLVTSNDFAHLVVGQRR